MERHYTLLCVRPNGVASFVDLVAAEDHDLLRTRAEALLREHGSCRAVEIWRGGTLVENIRRATAEA